MQNLPPEIKDPRAQRSRAALRSALLELLDEKSLDQITIRDIVARAGIGYTTFFRHHPTKEALLDDIASEQITALFKLSIPVLDAGDLRSAITALLRHVDEHRQMWKTLLTGGAAGTVREEFLTQAREVAAVRGNTEHLLPPDCGTLLLVSGALELITWWLRQEQPASLERVAEIFDTVVVAPVIQASGYR